MKWALLLVGALVGGCNGGALQPEIAPLSGDLAPILPTNANSLLTGPSLAAFRPASLPVVNSRGWRDETGAVIGLRQAGVVQNANHFYLYGLDAQGDLRMYDSWNLTEWNRGHVVFSPAAATGLDVAQACTSMVQLQQPTIVFNGATQKFVLLGRVSDSNGVGSAMAVATSSAASGNYIAQTCVLPGGAGLASMAVLQATDGNSYVVSSSDANPGGGAGILAVNPLAADFMSLGAQISYSVSSVLPQAAFSASGTNYVMGGNPQPVVGMSANLAQLANTTFMPLTINPNGANPNACSHMLQVGTSTVAMCDMNDATQAWMPLMSNDGMSTLLDSNVFDMDAQQGYLGAAHGVTFLDPNAFTSPDGGAWKAGGAQLVSPGVPSITVASGIPGAQTQDGTLSVSVDPGTAQAFILLYRYVSSSVSSGIVYNKGTWSIGSTVLVTTTPLQSGVFHRISVGFAGAQLAITVDGTPIYSASQPGTPSPGAVGFAAFTAGTFTVANAAIIVSTQGSMP